jgi:4-hydroxybenzoate polyprenyltransferase
MVFLLIGFAASLAITGFVGLDLFYVVGCFLASILLLLKPAVDLIKESTPESALVLFNKASLYPLVMLAIVVAGYYYTLLF